MSEQIITTKRGLYGRVNVTLPLPIKTAMLAWAKASGMKKAEFLRLALTTGFLELSKGISKGDSRNEGGGTAAAPARDSEDGRLPPPTPHTDRGVEFIKG